MVGLRLTIKGRVQGVGFRWFAKKVADNLGLPGTVSNLESGDVEICTQGDFYRLSLFSEAMRKGPTGAEVQSLDIKKTEEKDLDGFRVL
jgi:acylphosphatase